MLLPLKPLEASSEPWPGGSKQAGGSPPALSTAAGADADTQANALFEQLAASHCVPPTLISLARTPEGLGWVLIPDAHSASSSRSSGVGSSSRTSSSKAHGTAAATRGDAAGHATPAPAHQHEQHPAQQQTQQQADGAEARRAPTVLIRVPLRLCLSHEVPGCCPGVRSSRALAPLLNQSLGHAAVAAAAAAAADDDDDADDGDPTAAAPWEVVLAALLVWACRRPRSAPDAVADRDGSPGPAFAAFWRAYRTLLPPAAQQTSLTLWKHEELQLLQDPGLAAEAAAWQTTVLSAYRAHIDTPGFRAELESGRTVTLQEWLEAVGAVESRAFGFKSEVDGRELHAYVPFFCLANYRPGAPTLHVLRLVPPDAPAAGEAAARQMQYDRGSGPAGAAVEAGSAPGLPWQPTADMVALELPPPVPEAASSQGQDRSHACSERPQLYIDYGKKDSRSLVLQYGFVIHGNPYDRLDWGGCGLDPQDRMRREWVYDAAEALAQQLERLAPAEAAQAGITSGGAPSRQGDTDGGGAGAEVTGLEPLVGSGAASGDGAALEWAQQLQGPGGAAAARVRLRSAAASVIAACGWRNMRERRLVTPATEARAVGALTSWVSEQLKSFPTTLEVDLQLLAAMGAVVVAPGPARQGTAPTHCEARAAGTTAREPKA
ncbi:hypothetical protein HYH02_008833 [Chlamydomonas schloesseri]|uniref:Rubisco LSMT substrate-binding domain-containing protein n=1 Tax=Chlamydomonas schloesseri TaxID=2026947 RepID=A0A835WDG7_9CHLO|nr:hypothetical protein HYH02_008833 [Chlamydomonas schloesseri]|eukprot:KAG2445368.1 hypothetical protein HYH02_008833 [Chlamydomonas schloesseri]